MKKLLLLALIPTISLADGPFLDLDIGSHLKTWPECNCERSIGHENPLGVLRVGYSKKVSKHTQIHGYYEHMSSIVNSDTGVDVLMIGIRIK